MAKARRSGRILIAALACCAVVPNCRCYRPQRLKENADREVAQILTQKQAKVVGAPASFTVERPTTGGRHGDLPLRPAGEATTSAQDTDTVDKGNGLPPLPGAARLALKEALQVAATHSRDYQNHKEDLYLGALALTAERFRWRPQWAGTLAAGATRGPDDTWVEGHSRFSVSQLLDLGGTLTASLATDLLRFTTGDPRPTSTSTLAVEFLQPLYRKSGRLVAREPITQAERDTLYALRTFVRYRKSFCVDVTSRYYRALQQRDTVMNQWSNYKRIRQSRADTEEMARAGELPNLQVDQARQDELRAEANWVQAVRTYREQIDSFKVFLGLPAEAAVELDPSEVDRLRQSGLREVSLSPESAVETAIKRRLDLLTATDRVSDAERGLEIAKNNIEPDVGLKANATVPSGTGAQGGTYSVGLDVGLPLQRLLERNTYRQALITLERARRTADELQEQIKLNVRNACRTLQEAATSHRIERDSVELAQRRERASRELLRLGEAIARDLLEANEALVNAQNALTRTLVDHTLARLSLWRDTELLQVDETGVWQEVTDVNP